MVIDGRLLTGDNGCGGDVWLMRNPKYPELIAEESVSIRAVRRVYQELSGEDASALTPKDIFDIAEGTAPGKRQAAIDSFHELGEVTADAIIHALDIVDGLVVIGGGLAGAAKYILPGIMNEMKRPVGTFGGDNFPSLQMDVFKLEEKEGLAAFLTERDSERIVHDLSEVLYQAYNALIEIRRNQKTEPNNRNGAETVENDILPGKLIVPHGQPFSFPFVSGHR